MIWHLGHVGPVYLIWEDPELDGIFVLGLALMLAARRWRAPFAAASSLYVLGTLFNGLAVALNGWQMPVLQPAGWHPTAAMPDHVHHLLRTLPAGPAGWLADWVQIPRGIASPGDLLVWAGELAVLLAVLTWLVAAGRRRVLA